MIIPHKYVYSVATERLLQLVPYYRSTRSAGMDHSLFEAVNEYPPDPVLGLAVAYKADTHPQKVDLGIGAYRTDAGIPYVFPTVMKIQEILVNSKTDKEYLPIDGLPGLKIPAQELLFGLGSRFIKDRRISSVQTLSGTGALRVAAEFVKSELRQCKSVYLSEPTWPNHHGILTGSGFSPVDIKQYFYWNKTTRGLDIDKMLRDLRDAPEFSLVVLHACGHNPTGIDPTEDQWKSILEVVQERRLVPLFDCAYQGYASGSLERDAYAIRLFADAGLELFAAQSFAKNMGLYGERIGMLHVLCQSPDRAMTVLSQLKRIIRQMYSSPPKWGAQIALSILSDEENRKSWEIELNDVASRINRVRKQLRDGLVAKGTPGNFDHITQQIGMFSYTGLTPKQTEILTSKWHIYLLKSGRISLAGLNISNLAYVIDAIDDVVRHICD